MIEEAQQKIRELFYLRVRDHHRRFEFDLYNRSVAQKLWSTKEYCRELTSLDINHFKLVPDWSEEDSDGSTTGVTPPRYRLGRPYATDTESSSLITSRAWPIDTADYCQHLNCLLDGFLMNTKSALDALGHQISTLYAQDKRLEKIYIEHVTNTVLRSHTNSKLRELLSDSLAQPWFTEFLPYRNCTTHESLIVTNIPLNLDYLTLEYHQPIIPLPDDPQVKPFTYDKEREVKSYCTFILGKIESLTIEVYDTVLVDIETADNCLPVPRT